MLPYMFTATGKSVETVVSRLLQIVLMNSPSKQMSDEIYDIRIVVVRCDDQTYRGNANGSYFNVLGNTSQDQQ